MIPPKHRITLILLFYFAANALAAIGVIKSFWGIHFLMFFPVWTRVLILALTAALFFSIVRQKLLQYAVKATQELPKWLFTSLLIGFALASFVHFRSATPLLGDGAVLIRELELVDAGTLPRTDRAPLSFFLLSHLKFLGYSAQFTHQLYSWAAGILYVILSVVAAQIIGRNRTERIVSLGLLQTHGCMLFFFGYAETYALLLPTTLAYLVFGLRSLQNQHSSWLPAILLGILIPLHLIHTILIPSLAILGYQAKKNLKDVGLLFILTGIISCTGLWVSGIPPWSVLNQVGGTLFMSFTPQFNQPHGLISIGHFLDVLNQYLLVAPAALGIVLLCAHKLKPQDQTALFLVSATLPFIFFSFTANPALGAFRDWDIIGLFALPLMFWCSWIFVRSGLVASNGMALLGVGCIHLLLWVGVNATPQTAEARFSTILQAATLSPYARSYGWETLGAHYRSQNRLSEALHAYTQAKDADPTHPRHWNAVGYLHAQMGNLKEAIPAFEKSIEIDPSIAVVYTNLGNTLNQQGQYEDAIEAYQQALKQDPNSPETHTNLGVAYHRLGFYEQAATHHVKALEIEPVFAQALSNLGNTHNAIGNPAIAIEALQLAIKISPDYTDAHLNIADAYLAQQNSEMALTHLGKALMLQPDLISAHFKQGVVLQNLARFGEAIESFESILHLDIHQTDAHHHLGQIYDQLGQKKQARTHFEEILKQRPHHPEANLIRQWLQKNQ